MLGTFLKAGIGVGKAGASYGFGAARSGLSTEVGKMAVKGIGKLGVGYGIIQGSGSVADYAEQANSMGADIGGFWTGGLRTAGIIGGGGMMLGTAVRGIGRAAGMGYAGLNREAIDAGLSSRVSPLNRKDDMIRSRHAEIMRRAKNTDNSVAIQGEINRYSKEAYRTNPHKRGSKKDRIFDRRQRENKSAIAKEIQRLQAKDRIHYSVAEKKKSAGNRAMAINARKRALYRKERDRAMTGDMSEIQKFHKTGGTVESVISGMQNFSVTRTAGKGGMLGLKGARAVGRGAALAAPAVAADIVGTAVRPFSKKTSNALYSLGNKYMGARMFGWGTAAAGGRLAFDAYGPVDEAEQSIAGRNLALAGQQMYVPTSGRGPRRMMDPNATAGITQSLHRLR